MKIKTIVNSILFLVFISGCSSSGDTKDGPNFKKAAEINIQLGSRYLEQGNLQLAKTKLTKALQQDPDNALAHSTMALLLEKVGQYEEIDEYYNEAISLDPINSDIKNNFGTYLCNRARYDEARKQFNAALNDPYYKTPIVAMINAGKCEIKSKNYKAAEKLLRKALRINSQSVSALYFMGELGIKSQRYLMTRAYIQRYHAVAQASPQSLWIQIQAENALGDKQALKELYKKMNKNFPDSDEAGLMMELYRR